MRDEAHSNFATILRVYTIEDVTKLKKDQKQFLGYFYYSSYASETVSTSRLDDHHLNHDYDTVPSKLINSKILFPRQILVLIRSMYPMLLLHCIYFLLMTLLNFAKMRISF